VEDKGGGEEKNADFSERIAEWMAYEVRGDSVTRV